MATYYQKWWYPTNSGTPAIHQRAIVFGPGNNNVLANIYADADLTTPLANPTLTDGSGTLSFFVADDSGTYWIFVGPADEGASQEWSSGGDTGEPIFSIRSLGPDETGNLDLTPSDIDALPLSILQETGDLITTVGPETVARLPVGTPGQILSANPLEPVGLEWIDGSGGAVESVNGQVGVVVLDAEDVGGVPLDLYVNLGDVLASDDAGHPHALPLGTNGQVLSVNTAETLGVEWVDAPEGGVTSVNGQTGVVSLNALQVGAVPVALLSAKGDLITASSGPSPTNLSVGPNGYILSANPATGTGLEWVAPAGDAVTSVNGQVGVVVLTASDVGALPDTLLFERGNLATSGTTGLPTTQYLGDPGQVLRVNLANDTGLEWDTLTPTDIGAIPVAVVDAKGDLIVGSAADAVSRLAVGPNTYVLTADSAQAAGMKWAVPAADAVTSVNSQVGDVVLGAADVGALSVNLVFQKGAIPTSIAGGIPTSLDLGANGQVLTVNVGEPTGMQWQTPPGDAVLSVNGQTGTVVLTAPDVGGIPVSLVNAKGDIIVATANDVVTRLPVGTNGQLLSAQSSQPGGLFWTEPPVVSVNSQGGTVVLTAADVGAQSITGIAGAGDMYAGVGLHATTVIHTGADNQILISDSSLTAGVRWDTPGPYVAGLPFAYRTVGNTISHLGNPVCERVAVGPDVGTMFLYPMPMLTERTWQAFGYEVVVPGVVGAVIRLGLYTQSTTLWDVDLVQDFGTFASETDIIYNHRIDTSISVGMLWVGFAIQGSATTLRGANGWNPYVGAADFMMGTTAGLPTAYVATGITGALPATVGMSSTDQYCPIVHVTFA